MKLVQQVLLILLLLQIMSKRELKFNKVNPAVCVWSYATGAFFYENVTLYNLKHICKRFITDNGCTIMTGERFTFVFKARCSSLNSWKTNSIIKIVSG